MLETASAESLLGPIGASPPSFNLSPLPARNIAGTLGRGLEWGRKEVFREFRHALAQVHLNVPVFSPN